MVEVEIGVIQQPKAGNKVNGDSYRIIKTGSHMVVTVADGLGSGTMAQHASMLAVDIVERNLQQLSVAILPVLNDSLRDTRGAAVAIADIDLETLQLNYFSVGNIQGLIWGSKKTLLISTPGIIGRNYSQPVYQTSHQLKSTDAFILYTDGLTFNDCTDCHNGERRFTAQNLADYLVVQFKEKNDDLVLLTFTFC